jgi:hypothetical protein
VIQIVTRKAAGGSLNDVAFVFLMIRQQLLPLSDEHMHDKSHAATTTSAGVMMSQTEDSDATIIATDAALTGEEDEGVDESVGRDCGDKVTTAERWILKDATRPAQYVPVSRNSQLQLMKKFTMNHLWLEAANLMKMLLTDARHPPMLLFRYGMLVLEHHAPHEDESFKKYYQETISPFVLRFLSRNRKEKDKVQRAVLMNINKKEIILDAAALLFKHHCDDEIVHLFDWLRNHSTYEMHRFCETNRFIETYYNGYEAYMNFIKWRKTSKQRPVVSDDGDSDADDDDEHGSKKNKLSDQEQTLAEHLTSIVRSTSHVNVDLFLASLLEIYESRSMFDAGVTVTEHHAANHENDLNAHLRHYDMIDKRIKQIKSEDESSDTKDLEASRTKAFRQIVRLSPSHELVREVCDSEDSVVDSQNMEIDEDLMTRVNMMMNFLDYRQNMNDVTGWETMHALIMELRQSDQRSYRKFMRFFNGRICDYWESVHFNPKNIASDDVSLIQSKVAIAEMANACSNYRKAAKRYLNGAPVR